MKRTAVLFGSLLMSSLASANVEVVCDTTHGHNAYVQPLHINARIERLESQGREVSLSAPALSCATGAMGQCVLFQCQLCVTITHTASVNP